MTRRQCLRRLVGDSVLERRCRFLAGVIIFILVSAGFGVYGWKTESLLSDQTTQTARSLVRPALMGVHIRSNPSVPPGVQRQGEPESSETRIVNPARPTADLDPFVLTALERFRRSAALGGPPRQEPLTFADGTSMAVDRTVPGGSSYQYVQAVTFQQECLNCHGAHSDQARSDGKQVAIEPGDLACAVVVNLPRAASRLEINQHRAELISLALATMIGAMITSYVIIWYAVVKPVRNAQEPRRLIME